MTTTSYLGALDLAYRTIMRARVQGIETSVRIYAIKSSKRDIWSGGREYWIDVLPPPETNLVHIFDINSRGTITEVPV